MGFSLPKGQGDEEGIWTPYGDSEAYKIRPLRPTHMDHWRKVANKRKWHNGQMTDELNQTRYNELVADHVIEAWEGVFEDEAQQVPAECTLENKVALMGASLERSNFLISQARLYADDDEARKQAQRQSFRRSHQAPAGLPEA